MKLKPDWLNQLASAARQAPDDVSESLPRTEARVLGALRDHLEPKRLAWSPALLWSTVCAAIAVAMVMLRWGNQTPPTPRADLAEVQVLFEDEVWSTPTDALLADNGETDPVVEDLSSEINRLLRP